MLSPAEQEANRLRVRLANAQIRLDKWLRLAARRKAARDAARKLRQRKTGV